MVHPYQPGGCVGAFSADGWLLSLACFSGKPRGRVVACDSRVRYWAFALAFGGISATPICLPFFAEEPIRENETHTVSDARCASCPAERKDPAGYAPCG